MGIIHIVMFSFQPLATPEEVKGVCNGMLELKDKCLHPETNKPYLKMGIGGINNSPEGIGGGITHAFVSEFDSEEDRRYYLEKDPAHLAFVKSISGVVSKAQVVDFSPGVFQL
ncbi:putative stress responsive a b barrel domain protein [Phaeoacremonium minimum UCRPA7]|uniref:Putative stress responsive a b barrel domain protein n=1 Tax=Phaeoacremonium minimum (strain UCR-PA7) TaxID=1286976 RepID=R8BVU1_PHAM7|nr:putative stress responsive a b barrel domain protein [Phaeoacremonium minimum UCRPA7]EOO03409.1 putative stress responsive a b barrel domain protein [Phaeoacremonium minimum UCRPA7]